MIHGNAITAFLLLSMPLPDFWLEDWQLQEPTNSLTLFQASGTSQQDIIMQDLHQGLLLTSVYLKTISPPARAQKVKAAIGTQGEGGNPQCTQVSTFSTYQLLSAIAQISSAPVWPPNKAQLVSLGKVCLGHHPLCILEDVGHTHCSTVYSCGSSCPVVME